MVRTKQPVVLKQMSEMDPQTISFFPPSKDEIVSTPISKDNDNRSIISDKCLVKQEQESDHDLSVIRTNENENFKKLPDPSDLGQTISNQPDLKIVRRKINGYVGFANLPKQWHRKSIRRGFNLNILCVGAKGLGKSTLINTLFNKDLYNLNSEKDVKSSNNQLEDFKLENDFGDNVYGIEEKSEFRTPPADKVKMQTVSTQIEENGVVLKLTVINASGFGDSIDSTDSWKPIIKEINSRFDQYLDSENKINRYTIEDNRIHACLYFIEPTGHCLRSLDLEFFKSVHERCNLIPVIAKSDILMDEEIENFKNTIRSQLDEANIQLFQPSEYSTDDDKSTASKPLFDKMPFAVIGSTDMITTEEGKTVRGRAYPWGIVEVDNKSHSDFVYLRDLLIRQHLEELKDKTSKVLYERYRSEKLINLGIKQDNSVFKEFDPESKQQEERHLHEAKLAKLEAEMKCVFQQKVSEKEKKLQKSEAELFARHKEMKDKLLKQLKVLEEKKHQLETSLATQPIQSPAQPKKKGFLR